jgi:hypothetical protein
MFPILGWGCFVLGHFLHIFMTHATHFLYLRHFIFILHHLVLIVRNTFSQIFICMFDKFIKNDFSLALKFLKSFFTPKN